MIFLPNKPIKVGVFVSGGLDSALLYYLLNQVAVPGLHTIVPLVIEKTEHTIPLVTGIQEYFKDQRSLTIVDGTVQSAVLKCHADGYNRVYVGTIKELPEFLIGWQSTTYPETRFFHTPFKNIDKSQIVQLIIKEKQEKLFELTHSCANQPIGRCNECNRCRERKWAFDKLDLLDPGVL